MQTITKTLGYLGLLFMMCSAGYAALLVSAWSVDSIYVLLGKDTNSFNWAAFGYLVGGIVFLLLCVILGFKLFADAVTHDAKVVVMIKKGERPGNK